MYEWNEDNASVEVFLNILKTGISAVQSSCSRSKKDLNRILKILVKEKQNVMKELQKKDFSRLSRREKADAIYLRTQACERIACLLFEEKLISGDELLHLKQHENLLLAQRRDKTALPLKKSQNFSRKPPATLTPFAATYSKASETSKLKRRRAESTKM